MKYWIKIIFILSISLCFHISKSFAQKIIPNVGELIAKEEIQSRFSIIRIETDKEMCSPAVQIGPRVFLTAAHCTPLIASNGLVKLLGPGLAKTIHVDIISMPIVTDDDFFSGEECKDLIQNLPGNEILSMQQLSKCWFKSGTADIALLVSDKDIQSPMLSLGSSPPEKYEILNRLGETPNCGGDFGFFHQVQLRVFEFNHSQMILENSNTNINQTNISQCGGNSGGIYYRKLQDGSINIVGIHSASIQKTGPYVIYNKKIFLPLNVFGGTNLFARESNTWLSNQIVNFGLQICGINISCAGIRL